MQAAETYELPETLHALTSAVEAERTFWGHQNEVNSAEFSPDGERVVTASYDNTARVYVLNFDDLLRIAKERLPATVPPRE